jgi:hypothetical protein
VLATVLTLSAGGFFVGVCRLRFEKEARMSNVVDRHTTPISTADSVATLLDAALEKGEGLLRLAPTWVPRSFLHPGKRIKLAPGDWYAYGAHRGGIDERWFASTTEAANENRQPDEGLSYIVFNNQRFLLKDAVDERSAI